MARRPNVPTNRLDIGPGGRGRLSDLPGIDFVGLAQGYGIKGCHVDNATDFDAALADSFAHRGPSLIEVETSPTPSGMFKD